MSLDSPIIPRSARLISPASKNSGEGYSTALRFEPAERSANRGLLYLAIECTIGQQEAELVKATLVDTIKNEYYKESGEDSSKAFENAISSANDALGELSDKGSGSFVGKLSAIAAVIKDQHIMITKTGGAEAYLMRKDTVAQVTEELTNPLERPHPFKTFVSIAEGALELGDKLLLSTPGLFYHVSVEELKNILAENNPSGTIAHLARLLENEEKSRTSLLVVEISTPELVAHDFMPDGPSEIILSPGSSSFRVPVLSGVKTFTKELVGDSFASPVFEKAGTLFKKGMAHLPFKTFAEKVTTGKRKIAPHLSPALSKVRFMSGKPMLRRAGAMAALLLLIATGINAYRAPIIAKEKEAETSYTEAVSLFEEAEVTKIYDRNAAIEAVALAASKNQTALSHPKTKAQAEELAHKLSALSDELNGIVRLSEKEFASIPNGNWRQALSAGENLYLIEDTGRIISVTEGKSETVYEKLPANVVSAAYSPAGFIYLALSNGSIQTLELSSKKIVESASAGTYSSVDSLSVNTITKNKYSLYVLSEGRIYTQSASGTSLGGRTNYSAAAGQTDINLDNAVYMISGNTVSKYLNKRQASFSLSKPLPEKPLNLLTKGAIYLKTEGKNILHYSISGNYERQLPLENDANIFAIGDTGEIYLVTRDKVFVKK